MKRGFFVAILYLDDTYPQGYSPFPRFESATPGWTFEKTTELNFEHSFWCWQAEKQTY